MTASPNNAINPCRILAGLLVSLVALSFLTGCGEAPKGAEKLAGAYYKDIPVFEPSRVEETEGHYYSSGMSFDALTSYHAVCWTLSSPCSPEDIIAFYRENIPEAEETGDDDDEIDYDLDDEEGDDAGPEEISLAYKPEENADKHIEITIKLHQKDGRTIFSIFESVPKGKR